MNRNRPCFVTTSWDDGHPCDLRVAEMLARHDVPGTFYVPAASQRPTVGAGELRTLGQTFDIGAHTLRHQPLTHLPDSELDAEIRGSGEFLEQRLGKPCKVFAPPWGWFRANHVRLAAQAGFHGFRGTELMSLALPERSDGLVLMPTTMQLYRHRWPAYVKNAVRRRTPLNLALYFRHARGRDPLAAFESLLDLAIADGGVLHLWGHGWEIEECGEWSLLEEMLSVIAERRTELCLVSNSELCDWVLRNEHSAATASVSSLS